MAWATLNYSNKQIKRAGDVLAGRDTSITYLTAMEIMNNWRSFHSYPLNVIGMNLRQMAHKFSENVLISQRLKRVESIVNKLKLFDIMPLSSMQDIGGCRAVLENMEQVTKLVNFYLTKTESYHQRVKQNDYIQSPKDSGYRSYHFVYKYNSKFPKHSVYNGTQIEIQIRTKVQHAWATAVETAGMFLKTALKSNQGSDDWLRFFRLCGSLFATIESNPIEPELGTIEQIRKEIRSLDSKIDAVRRLGLYNSSVRLLETKRKAKEKYFILRLDTGKNELFISPFTSEQFARASELYLSLEQEQAEGMDIVLVSADSVDVLRKAYPNYFRDTTYFVELYNRSMNLTSTST